MHLGKAKPEQLEEEAMGHCMPKTVGDDKRRKFAGNR